MVKKVVIRCLKCGSTDARADESRSHYDFTFMQCDACGYGALQDPWQRDEWYCEVEETARPFGCEQCFGADPQVAWQAMRSARIHTLVEESHFSIHVDCCACGQRYAHVFIERIDWREGNDDQTWLLLPLKEDEVTLALASADLAVTLREIGAGRRFLVRDGTGKAWWRDVGFAIGPYG